MDKPVLKPVCWLPDSHRPERRLGQPMIPAVSAAQMIVAGVIWFVAIWGRALGAEPFTTWLYFFAWWPLLLFLDGLLGRLTGKSFIFQRPREFLRMAFFSVTIWLIFEVFNLWLLNWRYVGLDPRAWLRWPGYVLAYATVLPGVLLTAEVLAALGVAADLKGKARRVGRWQPPFLLIGVALLVLPFLAPHYAFPLIWLGFFFLLDPLVDLMSGNSLTRRLVAGERQRHLCLVLAGLLCGLWWELWNYPSLSKWVYTLPVLNFGKIFEMPVLGYLGFLPFALECAIMYKFLTLVDDRLSGVPRALFYLTQVAFWFVLFAALDFRTVLSFASG